VGIVAIASNSGSTRTSSSESEVKQTSMPHVIFYRTNGVRRSVTPRKELNQILITINLKYTLLSEHMCYKFIVHACAL
jgi:hypothetical protein